MNIDAKTSVTIRDKRDVMPIKHDSSALSNVTILKFYLGHLFGDF